jgi:hypothetical protein
MMANATPLIPEDPSFGTQLNIQLYAISFPDGYIQVSVVPYFFESQRAELIPSTECNENCQLYVSNDRVYVVAMRDIEPGEQLLTLHGYASFPQHNVPEV